MVHVAAVEAQIGALPTDNVGLRSSTDSTYRVGDVWEYRARSGEQASKFTVVKIDSSPNLGIIIHIAVDKLNWKTCQGDLLPQQVPHMPFAKKALEASAVRRVGTASKLPDFGDGYEEWRQAFLKKKAGIYTIPIKDAVTVAEETWRKGLRCGSESR